jgi:hypothetical protein
LQGSDFTWNQRENEVLLSPFFTFQVVEVNVGNEQIKNKITLTNGTVKTIFYKLTVITLVEVSYQNMLKTRQILPHTCVYFDKAINDKEIAIR